MPEKILVVDDEPDIVKVLSKILEISGYSSVSATNGEQALRMVREERPELVLLDYMMPDMTGLEVLKEIKRFSDDIYVVMVTGRGSEEVAAAVMKAGASDYVIKPFVKDQIVTVVKDTLRIRLAEIKAKKLQQELFELNRQLENKVEERTRDLVETQDRLIHQHNLSSLGEMSGGMAHEIRNPLNSIALYAQIMQDELPHEDPKKDYLNKILVDVDRINAIVTNLNRFSRRIKREKKPIKLQEPLEATLRTLSTKFINRGIDLKLDIEQGLPETLASPEEMEEVFTHLIINAIHAMPEGGELVIGMKLVVPDRSSQFRGRPEDRKEFIEVSVKDTGIGISKEDLGKIFIPFFTTKTDWEGTGLGLSVVDRVISDHDGTIDVESEKGKGTTFTLRLPVLESGSRFGTPQKISAVG